MLKKLFTLALVFCLASSVVAKDLSLVVYDPNAKSVLLKIGNANTTIGNTKAKTKFQAHVKMQFWGGENYISFHDQGIKGTPSLKDDILTLDLPLKKVEWFKAGSTLKWVETLKEKPASNILSLKIADGNEFDYLYQTPWKNPVHFQKDGEDWLRKTDEPLLGSERPVNIEGSYAVYHKFKKHHCAGKTNYKTGKVLHLPRPKAVDATGKWVWCDILIKDGIYKRRIDQDFLDNATYPVRINETFGHTAQGSAGYSGAADTIICQKFTLSEDGTITQINCWLKNASGSAHNMKLACYDHDAGNDLPENLEVGSGDSLVDGSFDGDWPIDVTDTGVSAGTKWLCKWSETSYTDHYYDNDGSNRWVKEGVSYDGWPDPFTNAEDDSGNQVFSIYATYTPSGEEAGQVIFINFSSMGYGFGGLGLILIWNLRNRMRKAA